MCREESQTFWKLPGPHQVLDSDPHPKPRLNVSQIPTSPALFPLH